MLLEISIILILLLSGLLIGVLIYFLREDNHIRERKKLIKAQIRERKFAGKPNFSKKFERKKYSD